MATAIAVQHLSKRYDTVTALADISFEVPAGETMGFLGPNGAGKTTTLRILTGMLAPTAGGVRIDGMDVTRQSLEVRRRIGYLPEHVALYPELRVREYLDYRSRIKGIPASERRSRINAALEQCALTDVPRQLVGRLSKGYRQRVALADCLLAQPKILILDEPTAGLDPHQIRQTRELIIALGRTTTILLSTHILPEVEMICQKVTIIDKGRIIAADTPDRLRQRLSGAQIVHVQLQGEASAIEAALRQLAGVVRVSPQGRADLPAAPDGKTTGAAPAYPATDVAAGRQAGGFVVFDVEAREGSDIREAIFRLAVERQWTLRELAQTHVSLEDVFIHLTTKEQDN